jgi:sugar phosphate isomerase/epimerase
VDFLLDVGHVHAAGFNPEEAVRAFGGKIGHVHLKDGKGQDIFRVPGEGEIDFAGFFAELQQMGYHGYCALELDGQGESVSERRGSVERALRFLESQNVELVGWER